MSATYKGFTYHPEHRHNNLFIKSGQYNVCLGELVTDITGNLHVHFYGADLSSGDLKTLAAFIVSLNNE